MNPNSYRKNMKAYCQILPPEDPCWDYVKITDDNKTIFVRCNQDFQKRIEDVPHYWRFETDGLLNSMNQETIFNTYIKSTLKLAFVGADLLIFAYGQTGSGKTTTISGLLNNFDNRGIAPRVLTELFELKDEVKYESKVKFQISYVEIFKSYIVDLINYKNDNKIKTPFKTISKHKIETVAEGWKYLFQGEGRRKINNFNKYLSNVATSIFTIFIKSTSKVISNPTEKYSKVHIIDMSGIDTYGNASCLIKNPLDIGLANLNKTVLERCILIIQEELRNGKRGVKDSAPLIAYLADSLSTRSYSIFLGHIRTNKEDLRITMSTLQFSSTIKRVKVSKLKTNIVTSLPLSIKDLQEKLNILQEQMYLNSMLKNNDLTFNLTQNRVDQIQHAIQEFIQNKTTELCVLNVTDAIIALNIFREICLKLESENSEALQKIRSLTSKSKMGNPGRINSSFSSKATEQRPSLKRRLSSGKRVSDGISRVSRQSHRHSIASYTTNKSNTDATKTLIHKSKSALKHSPSQIQETIVDNSDQMYHALGDFKIENAETNSIEEIWAKYRKDFNYNYEEISSTLEAIMQSTKEVLHQYNGLIDVLNKKIEIIDFKKYDLLKITLYQGMTSLQCVADENQEKHINETKEKLSNVIVELMKDSIQIKEDILTLLADLKIMVQEYHRNKKELNKDFNEYCINNFYIKMPSSDQLLESIEDELASPDADQERNETPDPVRDLFIKYQNTLKRNRLINNNIL